MNSNGYNVTQLSDDTFGIDEPANSAIREGKKITAHNSLWKKNK